MDFNKFNPFVKSSDYNEDEYDEDEEDYEDDDLPEDEPVARVPKSAPAEKSVAADDEDEEDYDDDELPEEPAPRKSFFGSKKSEAKAPKKTSRKGERFMARGNDRGYAATVAVKIPRTEDDTTEIVDMLLEGKAVLINVEGIGPDQAQRVIDYVSGACYAIDGKFQKVSHSLFVAGPRDVQLDGDFIEDLGAGFPVPSFEY